MKQLPGIFRFSLFVAAALSLSLAACKKDGEDGEAAAKGGGGGMQGPPPVPVVVEPAVLRNYAPAIELLGDIRARQRATLAAEVSGKVIKVSRRVGETAPKGQALIRIDPATYSAGLASAQAQLEQARQALNEAQAGPRREVVAAQESAVAAAQARYDVARDNLERQQALFAEGVISEAVLVAARSQADAAQAALAQEQQRLGELSSGTRTEQLAAARARVDAAVGTVEIARLSLERTTIAPPFEALVSQLLVEEGQFVGPGTPLAEVVALKSASKVDNEAWFNLPEGQARQVHPGATVELRADGLAEPGQAPPVITGTLANVSPAADPVTRQFPVRVSVDDARLRPGMTVRGRILTRQPVPTLMVPQDATTQSTLGLVVYRMLPPAKEGELPSAEAVTVTLGDSVDKFIVIASGELMPGEMIVTRGKEQLYPSAKIIPTNLPQPGGAEEKSGGPPAAADQDKEDQATMEQSGASGENRGD